MLRLWSVPLITGCLLSIKENSYGGFSLIMKYTNFILRDFFDPITHTKKETKHQNTTNRSGSKPG